MPIQPLTGGGPLLDPSSGLPYISPFTGLPAGGFGARIGGATQLDPNNPNHQRIQQALNASQNAGAGMFDAARAAWTILRPGEPFPSIPHNANALLQQSIGQLLHAPQAIPAATATPTATPTPAPTAAPSSPLPNLFNPSQSPTAPVGRLPSMPSEAQGGQQVSPLMQLFNFPRLSQKKYGKSSGTATLPGEVGQYNENFWNAWRI